MSRNKLKYLRELYRYASGTIRIRANGEVVKERVRFAIVRGQWVSIPVR
jgi:hypothetical protein